MSRPTTDSELEHRISELRRELNLLEREKQQRHNDLYPQEHTIYIIAAGCETTRECYCWATVGKDHTESESPWVGQDDKPVTV